MADKVKEGDLVNSVPGAREEDGEEISRYRQILLREPSSLVFAALAEAYRKRGMPAQSIEVCAKGLRHHPNYMSGRVALARAYFDNGQINEARQELEKVVAAVPENLIAQRLLSSIYRDQGELDRMEDSLRRILLLDPQDGEASEVLDRLEASRCRPLPESSDSDVEEEIVTRTLAEIYASQGYLERAAEIYLRLCTNEPDNPVLRARLSELRAKTATRPSRARGKGETRL